MIDALKVTRFKCFDALRLALRPLTLFSGYNGGGKSSFIQPLLLLSQALKSHTDAGLPLNGAVARLGTVADVVRGGNPSFEVSSGDDRMRWDFTAKAGGRALGVQDASAQMLVDGRTTSIRWNGFLWPESEIKAGRWPRDVPVLAALSELITISATRPGVLDVQPMPDAASPVRGDVGVEGQHASYWYDALVDEVIDEPFRLAEAPGTTMRMQVDAYLSRLFTGAQANVTAIPQTAAYALRYRIGDGDWRRPANIGYGFTYAFPIVVALLAARPGQILVIDSPEAHLHPSAQSQMGGLLAKVASGGVQLLIETHSDHLLNGIRLAVKRGEVPADDVATHFFAGSGPDGHGVTSPRMDAEGRLSDWPTGFFDQNEADLARLAGWA